MRDITKYFMQAKELGLFTLPQLKETINEISSLLPDCTVDWDDGAGEEWARFYNTSRLFCMLHTKIKIAFSVVDLPDIKAKVISVNSFTDNNLSIDLDEIRDKCRELSWYASADAVDPLCFDLHDLYYATV